VSRDIRAFLDTCVVYPPVLRDVLLMLARHGFFEAVWSRSIIVELRRALISKGGLSPDKADNIVAQFNDDDTLSLCDGHEALAPAMTNHPKDRHVLAAAVRSSADVIVTFNTNDFPHESVAPFHIEVATPDDFLVSVADDLPHTYMTLHSLTLMHLGPIWKTMDPIPMLTAKLGRHAPKFVSSMTRFLRG
jgi:predicted nucleic acid-binding protein